MTDLQQKILEIFKTVAATCDENGIDYYAIGGTCLGAVRHQGFIPWDDDLDIAIPVEQYDRFFEVAEKELPEYLSLRTCYNSRFNYQIFSKVVDERTTFLEPSEIPYPEAYKGVFVDVMPLAGVPSAPLKRKAFFRRTAFLRFVNKANRLPKERMTSSLASAARLLKKADWSYYTDAWLKMLKRNPVSRSEQVGYVWSKNYRRLIFDKKDFETSVLLPFEDTMIRCPAGWDDYLTAQFGDYMKLPPAEEQINKHSPFIDLEHSYHEYQSGARKLP